MLNRRGFGKGVGLTAGAGVDGGAGTPAYATAGTNTMAPTHKRGIKSQRRDGICPFSFAVPLLDPFIKNDKDDDAVCTRAYPLMIGSIATHGLNRVMSSNWFARIMSSCAATGAS
jgi:hypothetical protein